MNLKIALNRAALVALLAFSAVAATACDSGASPTVTPVVSTPGTGSLPDPQATVETGIPDAIGTQTGDQALPGAVQTGVPSLTPTVNP